LTKEWLEGVEGWGVGVGDEKKAELLSSSLVSEIELLFPLFFLSTFILPTLFFLFFYGCSESD
jgi:hypothetical protein